MSMNTAPTSRMTGELVADLIQLWETASGSGWANIVRNTAATMPSRVGGGLGDVSEEVAGEVDQAPLVR